MDDKEASTSAVTPPMKVRRTCYYDVDWKSRFSWLHKCDEDNTKSYCKLCKTTLTVTYDGVKALTQHINTALSQRMNTFFTPKGSARSEKVSIAELAEVYHSIKYQILYVAQDCSLKVLKQVITDSEIVNK
ncbi:unnamed protein product [Parnassius apollo]|uniref:(apollo) hypothetical protein n=1 Tax=Parnassius apollo TaxID=110799 RepID=A0A8S3W8G6_PARAO|nr:unnamed protein product [Parnassius apollo]